MTPLPPVVCFGNDWFSDNRTSSHQIARQLARRTAVLYFGCPGLRPPSATGRDAGRLLAKARRALSGTRSSDGVRVRTLPQLPLHGNPWAVRANVLASRLITASAIRRERFRDPIVWCTVPHVVPFVTRLRRALLVYHCVDRYASLPGVNAAAVEAMDRQLARAADVVFAASGEVFEAQCPYNASVIRVPHGVDVEHFASAPPGSARPPEFEHIRGPVVGYIGLIEHWIDLPLVGWLARELPKVTFLMIGRVAVPASNLPSHPNVRFVGPRPYEALPSYGAHFDAAIIPYRLTPQVLAASPLKLREYLAMGLPVVSVPTPDIAPFGDVVSIAATREAFLAALRAALDRGPEDGRQVRQARVASASWESRTAEMLQHVLAALAQRKGHAAA